jgi:hypothetical protein
MYEGQTVDASLAQVVTLIRAEQHFALDSIPDYWPRQYHGFVYFQGCCLQLHRGRAFFSLLFEKSLASINA